MTQLQSGPEGEEIAAVEGPMKALEDPSAGATGRWARLSNRERGFVRLAIAILIFAAFSGMLAIIERTGHFDMLNSRGPIEFGACCVLFTSVYLFIWGLVTAVSGRSWRDLSTAVRIGALVVLTPLVFPPVFMLVLFPGAIVEELQDHYHWIRMLSPGYPEFEKHVLALDRLESLCSEDLEDDGCACDHMADMQREMAAIQAVMRAHPTRTYSEVRIELGHGDAELLDPDVLQARLPDPSMCK